MQETCNKVPEGITHARLHAARPAVRLLGAGPRDQPRDHRAAPRQAPRGLCEGRQRHAGTAGGGAGQGVVGLAQRAGEEPGLPSVRAHPAQHLLAEHDRPEGRRRRAAGGGRRGRTRRRHQGVLRLLRRVQEPVVQGGGHHPGLRLGRARVRAAERAADRGAGLRPPGQRRPGLDPDPGLRRLGARLLPPVQEPEGRLHRGHVAGGRLAGRGPALRGRRLPRERAAARAVSARP
ncbi:hypothetical protein SGPA1_30421 [Streptomyces misionensis JCM 4497]